ncbi:cytochrome P450 [Halodurantibacterium flavum]|uniref:Cytochrome P450 n=1 Tax=Halodurantibacterium flavum TaxID=1382802 RepID=A0ABW4S0F0_9RHOB
MTDISHPAPISSPGYRASPVRGAGSGIPRDVFDASIPFLREGYSFISSRCDLHGTDAFRTRVMLTPVICMRGADAARMFYGGDRFTRKNSMPASVLHLLQDLGSVQSLDGDPHRLRKAMFLAMMSPAGLDQATAIFAEEFRAAARLWAGGDRIMLHGEFRRLLTRTVLRWAGIPLDRADPRTRARELGAMVDHAGSLGPANLWAQRLRRQSERWAKGVVADCRRGRIAPPDGSALALIASHRDIDGRLLDLEVAAVELLNVLRPTVAVDRFLTFIALALHCYPGWRARFAEGGDGDVAHFVQEVRRYYPFFPGIGGRVARPFDWHGHLFRTGQWVLLDLYGTNHHPDLWENPQAFRPERFRDWADDGHNLIPQGAGDFLRGHRCPGEWLTIALMEETVRLLSREVDYDVPAQNLEVRMTAMPALPQSGFVISNLWLAG